MGFNFRKSFKIAPGVRLNVTKNGISSVSVGRKGANVNIGKKGTKTTLGIPGTGMSYSKYTKHQENTGNQPSSNTGVVVFVSIILLLFCAYIFL